MNHLANNLAAWIADYYLLATLLLGLMLLTRSVVRQPARRLAVAWGGVAGLALLAVLVALPGWSVIHLFETPVQEIAMTRVPPVSAEPAAPGYDAGPMTSFASDMPYERGPLSELPPPARQEVAPAAAVVPEPAKVPIWPIEVVFSVAFLVGCAITVAWCLIGAWQLQRLVGRSTAAEAKLNELFATLGETRPALQLRLTGELSTAVALGLWRPMILLPTHFAQRHDAQTLRVALAHELAHVRNGDLWLVAALRLVMLVLWAHPGYWLVRRGVRLDQELLADAAAAELTSRDTYAEQLVGWARQMPAPRSLALAGAVGLWETGSQLRQRIRLLLDERLMIVRSCSRRWKVAAMGLCAALGVGLSLVTLEPRETLAEEPAPEVVKEEEGGTKEDADYSHLKTFEVQVVGPDGSPVDGAEVTPWALRSSQGHGMWRTSDNNPKEAPTVTTDADGVARIPYPEYSGNIESSLVTEVTCRVVHPEFASVEYEFVAVPQPGRATIKLERAAIVRLSGIVGGEPIPASELYALWSTPGSHARRKSVDDAGNLVLSGVGAGLERIRIVHLPKSGPVRFSKVMEVHLEAGEDYPLIEELHPATRVLGRLSDNVPRPVRNGKVVAEVITPRGEEEAGFESMAWSTWAPIKEDGTFELTDLPAGEHLQVIALCDGFAASSGAPPEFVSEVERARRTSFNRPQTFLLEEQASRITLEMAPTAAVEVRVVDREAQGIGGIVVATAPNVLWWDGGSQIYCENEHKSLDSLTKVQYAAPSLEASLFHAKTNAEGFATIRNIPAPGQSDEHLWTFGSLQPLKSLGNPEGERIVVRPGETSRKTLVIDRPEPAAVADEIRVDDAANSSPVEWPATLSGEIRDDQDQPIPGAKVKLTLQQIHEYTIGRWDETLETIEGVTDEGGRYTFDLAGWPELRHRPFAINLRATAEGHSDGRTWSWYSSDNKVGEKFQKLTLPRGRKVTGTLVDPDGKPVVGAVIHTVVDYGSNSMHEPRVTGASGKFELMLSREGGAQVWICGSEVAPKFLEITKGTADLGEIRLERGTALEGTVRDATGNPVAGCVVVMSSGYDGELRSHSVAVKFATTTDTDGHYRLPPARGGYKVYLAMAEKSHDQAGDRFVVGTSPPPLVIPQWHELSGEEETKRADFTGSEPVELGGTIRWRDGTPAEGVEVKASYLPSPDDVEYFGTGIWIDRTLTDADGKYTLKLPKGITAVTLSCFGARDKDKKWHSAFVTEGVEGIRTTEQFMDLQEMTLNEGRDDLDWVIGEEEPPEKEQAAEETQSAKPTPEMSIVVAKYFMLLEGKHPITWQELEQRIAQLDDPSTARLHYWMTGGAREDGQEELWRLEHDRLREKFKLGGYSIGSLSPRTEARYDKLETLEDLEPDPQRAVAGRVVDTNGKPVAGAEVLLVEPVDDSVAYKTTSIHLVEGRLRNRLDDVVVDSDANGDFVHYPSTDDVQAYLLAMHPEHGFSITRQEGRMPADPLVLRPWGTLKGGITPQKGYSQSASVVSVVKEAGGWPTVQFHQMMVDRDPERKANTYEFTTIPPDIPTMLQRSIASEQGGSFSPPGKELTLAPGEKRTENIGPLTEDDRAHIKMFKELSNRANSPPEPGSRTASGPPPGSVRGYYRLPAGKFCRAKLPPA